MLFDALPPYPCAERFSRQQLQEISGVPDDVLGYWLKQGLLVPEPVRGRQHRKFRFVQIHIAAVLNGLRAMGANITVLRAFASKLQRGVELIQKTPYSREQIYAAAELGSRLARFRAGHPRPIPTEAWLANLGSSKSYNFEGESHALPTSAQAIIDDYRRVAPEVEPVVKFAQTLSGYDAEAMSMVDELANPEFVTSHEMEWGWIAWPDSDGDVHFISGENGNLTTRTRPGPVGFWIDVSFVIRRLWMEDAPKPSGDRW